LDARVLAGADVVLVDPRWVAGAAAALRWARGSGVASILDADVAEATDLHALVPLAQWAAFSEAGLAAFGPDLTVEQGLQSALRSGCALALVTRGQDGALWTCGQSLIAQSTPRVDARDTTGAGDVFHGALAVARAEGLADQAAVEFACVAAALKCQRGQGAQGAPTRQELNRFITQSTGSRTITG
jgi:sulfofructose kinase